MKEKNEWPDVFDVRSGENTSYNEGLTDKGVLAIEKIANLIKLTCEGKKVLVVHGNAPSDWQSAAIIKEALGLKSKYHAKFTENTKDNLRIAIGILQRHCGEADIVIFVSESYEFAVYLPLCIASSLKLMVKCTPDAKARYMEFGGALFLEIYEKYLKFSNPSNSYFES